MNKYTRWLLRLIGPALLVFFLWKSDLGSIVANLGNAKTPNLALRELERAILAQDRSLDLPELSAVEPDRTVLVLPRDDDRLEGVLAMAKSFAAASDRELIVARLVANETQLRPAVAAFNSHRKSMPAGTRTAAFTTLEPGRDAVRLATIYDVDLVLIDAPPGLADDPQVPDDLATLFEHSPADVGVLAGGEMRHGSGVFVPFAGGDHDWDALELGAWLSLATSAPLRLVGTKADPRRGQRDAGGSAGRRRRCRAAPRRGDGGVARRRGRRCDSCCGRDLATLATGGHRRHPARTRPSCIRTDAARPPWPSPGWSRPSRDPDTLYLVAR